MKNHPILDLQCNEDGTKIIFEGNQLHQSKQIRRNPKTGEITEEAGVVSILGKKISVVRIVCECYHGMRPDKSYFPQREDKNVHNNHYTNLSWGKRRGHTKIFGKVKEELYKDLSKSSSAKDLKAYAKKYGVTIGTIREHKKKHYAESLEVDFEYIH